MMETIARKKPFSLIRANVIKKDAAIISPIPVKEAHILVNPSISISPDWLHTRLFYRSVRLENLTLIITFLETFVKPNTKQPHKPFPTK